MPDKKLTIILFNYHLHYKVYDVSIRDTHYMKYLVFKKVTEIQVTQFLRLNKSVKVDFLNIFTDQTYR